MAKKQTPEPIALPTQIDASERDYLNTLLAQAQAAQAAIDAFSGYLSTKYQLVQGDSLQRDGQIVRKANP